MKIQYFNIHDMIGVEWHNPLFSVVPDFAQKFHYFRVAGAPESCPVQIEIHSGEPPRGMFDDLMHVSERFSIGRNGFSCGHQHGRMRWRSWVTGLDTARVRLWYDFPWYLRLQWPWPCFPDYMIGFQVIQPIIEYKLQEQGAIVMHAGAFERNGEVCLLSGRGGVHKTTYIMHALQNGGRYFADDLVILKDRKLYAYPLLDTFFDYFYLYETSEKVNRKSMLGAFFHIRRGRPISFPVAPPQKADKVFLLLGSDAENSELAENQNDTEAEFIDRMLAVDKLERLSLVDEEEVTGRFMLQFNQVFGNDCWNAFWRRHRELMVANLSGLPMKIMYSGKKSNLEIM